MDQVFAFLKVYIRGLYPWLFRAVHMHILMLFRRESGDKVWELYTFYVHVQVRVICLGGAIVLGARAQSVGKWRKFASRSVH